MACLLEFKYIDIVDYNVFHDIIIKNKGGRMQKFLIIILMLFISIISLAEKGKATYYGAKGLTAAHRTLPFGTKVKVTNVNNGKSVIVTINDRGPFIKGRIIDMSKSSFAKIADLSEGVVDVEIEVVEEE